MANIEPPGIDSSNSPRAMTASRCVLERHDARKHCRHELADAVTNQRGWPKAARHTGILRTLPWKHPHHTAPRPLDALGRRLTVEFAVGQASTVREQQSLAVAVHLDGLAKKRIEIRAGRHSFPRLIVKPPILGIDNNSLTGCQKRFEMIQ
jgi:hypothetical protein